MADLINQLVKDIIPLEPTLAKEEALVRQTIISLQQNQPELVIDDLFKSKLRAELLSTRPQPSLVPGLPWWMIYTAPIGVAALLILMVWSNDRPVGVPPTFTSVNPPAISSGSDVRLFDSPEAVQEDAVPSLYKMPATAPDMAMKTSMSEVADPLTTLIPGELLEVGSTTLNTIEFTKVVVALPSFVVIREESTGIVLASSDLLLKGSYEGLSLTLTTDMAPGSYEATLYRDADADGVFTAGLDYPVLTLEGLTYTIYLGRSE